MPLPNLFPGSSTDRPLGNPVRAPGRGAESLSSLERAASAHTLRDADAEQDVTYADARPVHLVLAGGTPPALAPPGTPRPARSPRTNDQGRRWPRLNDKERGGLHGELTPGAHPSPVQSMNPGLAHHRNTWRLEPQPWDAAYYVTPASDADA